MDETELIAPSYGYDLIEKLETTLTRFHILYEYSDIDITEQFDEKYRRTITLDTRREFNYQRHSNNLGEESLFEGHRVRDGATRVSFTREGFLGDQRLF